jgi:hypothetical protein
VRNVPVVIEDVEDKTSKVKAGGREMFISATSQMTRASRAIRLIPFDPNRQLFRDVFKEGELAQKSAFFIQGSVSQFDDSLLKKQRDGGICLGVICLGGADSDSFSGMSIDMSVLNVQESMSLVPGAISKNFVLIRKSGKGADADMTYKKFGVNFNFVNSQSDGTGQALRNLIELSAIELYGRLLKVPYWACLGVPDDDEGVKSEIDDWWDMLQGDLPSLVIYLQSQMTARQLWKGDINGEIDDALLRAVRAYKFAMGLKDDENIDNDFFRRYLTSNHAEVQPKAQAKMKAIEAAEGPIVPAAPVVAQAAAAPAAAAPAAAPPPAAGGAAAAVAAGAGANLPAAAAPSAQQAQRASAVAVQGTKGPTYVYKRGESFDVEVAVANRGFLYCYLIDDNKDVVQFFPNPAQASAAVAAGQRMLFPGRFPFQLMASAKGATETIACFASPQDLGPNVALAKSVRDIAALRQAISQRAGAPVEVGVFDVKTQ